MVVFADALKALFAFGFRTCPSNGGKATAANVFGTPYLTAPFCHNVQIEIRAERNEILDQGSLIARYQSEIAALRAQLEEAARGQGVGLGSGPDVDLMHPEVGPLPDRTITYIQDTIKCIAEIVHRVNKPLKFYLY